MVVVAEAQCLDMILMVFTAAAAARACLMVAAEGLTVAAAAVVVVMVECTPHLAMAAITSLVAVMEVVEAVTHHRCIPVEVWVVAAAVVVVVTWVVEAVGLGRTIEVLIQIVRIK